MTPREILRQRREAAIADPLVQTVLKAFPGAVVVDVRDVDKLSTSEDDKLSTEYGTDEFYGGEDEP